MIPGCVLLLLLLLWCLLCQGVVTGVVEGTPDSSAPAANIMNSALYKLALGESQLSSHPELSRACMDAPLFFTVSAYHQSLPGCHVGIGSQSEKPW
jgi:hypothetical protein